MRVPGFALSHEPRRGAAVERVAIGKGPQCAGVLVSVARPRLRELLVGTDGGFCQAENLVCIRLRLFRLGRRYPGRRRR